VWAGGSGVLRVSWLMMHCALESLPLPTTTTNTQPNTPYRRAKRLKKLTRLFTSSTAQSATITFRQRTWLLTVIILGAHLVAFTILVTQIESRYA